MLRGVCIDFLLSLLCASIKLKRCPRRQSKSIDWQTNVSDWLPFDTFIASQTSTRILVSLQWDPSGPCIPPGQPPAREGMYTYTRYQFSSEESQKRMWNGLKIAKMLLFDSKNEIDEKINFNLFANPSANANKSGPPRIPSPSANANKLRCEKRRKQRLFPRFWPPANRLFPVPTLIPSF